MAAFIAVSFLLDWPQNGLLLRTFRWAGSLSASILFLPLSGLLFRGIACSGDDWLETGASCTSPGRVITAVLAIMLVLVLTVLAILVALVFHDKDPTSASWAAKATGRLDVAILLIMLLLSLVSNLLSDQLQGGLIMTLVHIACGGLWYYLQASMLVHPLAEMNGLMGGFSASYLWFGLCLAIAQASPAGQDHSALLLLGGITAGTAGGLFVYVRQLQVVSVRLEDFSAGSSSVYDLNAWIRHRLRKMAKLESLADATTAQAYAAAAAQEQEDNDSRVRQSSSAAAATAATYSDMGGTTMQGSSSATRNAQSGHQGHIGDGGVSAAVDRASRARMAEQRRLLREAFRGMHFLLTQFPQSEMACMLASIGFRDHSPWLFHEAVALARARGLSPSLDVLFHIYQRATQLRETGSEGASPIDRVLFDQMFSQAQEARTKCFQLLTRLWATMAHTAPDLDELWSVGLQLQRTLRKADSLHRAMLELNGDSASALRAYAKHLLDLGQDPDRAQELLNKADRLEEVHKSDKRKVIKTVTMLTPFSSSSSASSGFDSVDAGGGAGMASASAAAAKRKELAARGMLGVSAVEMLDVKAARLSIMDESSAVIAISGQGSSTGEIVAASPAACRMLGYTQSALLGHNINSVLPEPIRSAHDSFLNRFAAAPRQRTRVLNRDRAVFYQRQDGSLVPAWNTIIETPPDEQTFEPRFTAVMRPIVSEDDYITFAPADGGFRMYAATQRSVDLLGLTHEQLGDGRASMLTYFPTAASSFTSATVELDREQVRQLRLQSAAQDINRQFGLRKLNRRTRRASMLLSKGKPSERDGSVASGPQTGESGAAAALDGDDLMDMLSQLEGSVGGTGTSRSHSKATLFVNDKGVVNRSGSGRVLQEDSDDGTEGPGLGKRGIQMKTRNDSPNQRGSLTQQQQQQLLDRAGTSLSLRTDGTAGGMQGSVASGGQQGRRIADVKPLLSLMGSNSGLIPAVGTPQGDVLLLGSVQFVPLPAGAGDFFVLRWRFADKRQEEELARVAAISMPSSSLSSDELEENVTGCGDFDSDKGSDVAVGSDVLQGQNGGEAGGSQHHVTQDPAELMRREHALTHSVGADHRFRTSSDSRSAVAEEQSGQQEVPQRNSMDYLGSNGDHTKSKWHEEHTGVLDSQGSGSPILHEGPIAVDDTAHVHGTGSAADGPRGKDSTSKPMQPTESDQLNPTLSRSKLRTPTKERHSRRPSVEGRVSMELRVSSASRQHGRVDSGARMGSSMRKHRTTQGNLLLQPEGSSAQIREPRMAGIVKGMMRPSADYKTFHIPVARSQRTKGIGGESLASSGSNAVLAVRRNIRNLTKVTEPEVVRSRKTLIFLVVSVLIIGVAMMIWLEAQLVTLRFLTKSLTKSGERMLQFEFAMSYAEDIDRYSASLNATSTDFVLDLHDTGSSAGANLIRDVAMMTAHAKAMRIKHEELYDSQEDGGKTAFSFEMDRTIDVLQPSADVGSEATQTRTTNLVDLGMEMHAAFARFAELPVQQMNTGDSVSLRFLLANYDVFIGSMNQSLALRQEDFASAMPRIQLDIILGGMLSFLMCAGVAAPVFYTAVQDISDRTTAVTMLLLHVPRRLAKALKDRAQQSLDRMIVEQEEGKGGGLDDEVGEQQMLVDEADGDEAYQGVLRAAERQVARRMAQHARNLVSTGSQSELLPGKRTHSVADGVAYVDIQSASQTQSGDAHHDSKMKRSSLVLSSKVVPHDGRRMIDSDAPSGLLATKAHQAASRRHMSDGYAGSAANQTYAIPPPSRPHQTSSSFVSRKVMLLLSPVILILGLLSFISVYFRFRMITTETAIKRVTVVEQSALHCQGATRQAIRMVLSIPGSTEQMDAYERIVQHDRLITQQSELIQFGGVATSDFSDIEVDLPPLPARSTALELLLNDACTPVYQERWSSRSWDGVLELDDSNEVLPFEVSNASSLLEVVAVDEAAQLDECRQVEGGALGIGLLSGIVGLRSIIKDLLSQISPAAPAAMGTDENIDRLMRMIALELPHMRDAYGLTLWLMDTEVGTILQETRSMAQIVTYVFTAAFTMAVALYYWPQASSLQESLQSARELLTLVPEEVQMVVTPLRRGLQVIASKQETGEQGLPGLSPQSRCCGCCRCRSRCC